MQSVRALHTQTSALRTVPKSALVQSAYIFFRVIHAIQFHHVNYIDPNGQTAAYHVSYATHIIAPESGR